jgi:signal transduction histidine kinase
MIEMMEDLLLYGKLEAAKMDCKPKRVDVAALCREIISEVSCHANVSRSIKFTIGDSVGEEFLDERILRHVLGNLLTNAVKYSVGDQAVSLEVKRVLGNAQTQDDSKAPFVEHLQLKVVDSGIGIPAADLAKIFQTFHRASNVGNLPGTGMGMAIVKQCVDLHRGTIKIESEEGKGTTVWIHLPLGLADPVSTGKGMRT